MQNAMDITKIEYDLVALKIGIHKLLSWCSLVCFYQITFIYATQYVKHNYEAKISSNVVSTMFEFPQDI